ncbi:MAG TPA: hypothetical protein VLF18_21335 [Tahibacter sp.]|nr:hypothetical protein [Tahibacter sp.]HSX62734.1 hypothetical protein [Tahibacter sp.]
MNAWSWRRVGAMMIVLLVAASLTLLWLRWGETMFARQLGALVC